MTASSADPITIALMFIPTSGGAACTVVVSAAAPTSWGQVLPLLPPRLQGRTWYAGVTPVSDDALVGDEPLLHTAELTDAPHTVPPRPLLELVIAEGPDCGLTWPVASTTVIGRATGCEVTVDDRSLSRAHAQVEVSHGHAAVRDLASTNGTWVDQDRVQGVPRELRVGQRLRTGGTVSRLSPVTPAPPLPVRGGRRALSRPPRLVPEPSQVELTAPRPPHTIEHSIPWLMLLLPMPVAVILALLLRSPMFLAFAIFSPLMMFGQYLHDRIGGRRSRRTENAEFARRTAQLESEIDVLLQQEVEDRRRLAPDLGQVAHQARTGQCWARRPGDRDHLHCRLGTGTVVAGVRVRTDTGECETFTLPDMPITLDLATHRISAITGAPDLLDRAVDSVLGQLVATHSPVLLRVIVVSSRATEPDRWGWAAWLPHLRPDTTDTPQILDPDRDQDRMHQLLGPWTRDDGETHAHGEAPDVHTVVLLDGAGLTHRPLLHALVQHGAARGVAVLGVAPTADGLPGDATATVVVDAADSGRLLTTEETQTFRPDLPAGSWRCGLATALAGTVDTTPGAHGGEPPAQVRLLDVLDCEVAADPIRVAWQRRSRGTEALLGLGADGPVLIDLLRDGPHALIGGTTGSGKSELLQTLITSLALVNRPDQLVFLLIDYKGGAAFKDCTDLPHTVGLVTDLDPFLTRRALASLDAEIRHRERLLASVGATDLLDYQEHSAPGDPTIPRLVLVIDEFRVLAEELPDFIDGVVRIATVGRSLGIHLVLATQRPGGILSPDIRANVSLRIALRVRDATDSDDVIESPAASLISAHTPGRALLRTGSAPPVALQTARVTGTSTIVAPVRVLAVDARTAGVVGGIEDEPCPGPSDLRRLVDAMATAAQDAGVPRVPSPWLPPLPSTVSRDDVGPADRLLDGGVLEKDVPTASLGLIDLPDEQRQATVGWALGSGHLAVVGGSRSGRTTTLRTIAAGLGQHWSPDDLHVYAVDTGAGLGALSGMPHTGAVVSSAEPSTLRRMLEWFAEEIARRRQQLAQGDHADVVEQRRDPGQDEPLPFLVLLLDGWDSVQAEYELADDAVLDTVVQLLREGPAAGLSVALTGGRALLSGRVTSAVQHRLCLRTADEMDLVLAGLRVSQVPKDMPPGRALLPDGDEVQVALPGSCADGAGQSSSLREIGAAAPAPRRRPPQRFHQLPDRVELTDLADDPTGAGPPMIGIGEHGEPARWAPDAVHGQVALIAGPPGSGRTTALRVLATQLIGRGPVLWHPSAETPQDLPDGVHLTHDEDVDTLWCRLSEAFVTLVLDDIELLSDPHDELALAHLSRCGAGLGALLVAGTTPDLLSDYRGIAYELRRRQSGLLLQPARGDGELLGAQVAHTGRSVPGRGVLVHRTRGVEVQVAQPPPAVKVHDLLTDERHTAGDVW